MVAVAAVAAAVAPACGRRLRAHLHVWLIQRLVSPKRAVQRLHDEQRIQGLPEGHGHLQRRLARSQHLAPVQRAGAVGGVDGPPKRERQLALRCAHRRVAVRVVGVQRNVVGGRVKKSG